MDSSNGNRDTIENFYNVDFNEIKDRRFATIDDFYAFCESVGIDSKQLILEKNIIRDGQMTIASLQQDGSVLFPFSFSFQGADYTKARIDELRHKYPLKHEHAAVEQVSIDTSQEVERTIYMAIKGRLRLDETTHEYYITNNSNGKEIRFKFEDIRRVGGVDCEVLKDGTNTDEIINYINRLIDSQSILTVKSQVLRDKVDIEIEVAFDLSR